MGCINVSRRVALRKTMSSTKRLIAELITAANEVEKLGTYEMAELLERSIITIREMRASLEFRLKRYAKDPLLDLEKVQRHVMQGIVVFDEVVTALKGASSMIGDLYSWKRHAMRGLEGK